MGSEIAELWQAMKETKYQNVLEELESISSGTGDFNEILNKSLNIVVEAVHAEAGTLWYYDYYNTGRIYPKAVYGGKEIKDFSLGLGEGVAGSVIQNVKSEMIVDCQKDERWAGKVDANTGFITKTMICVPLGNKQTSVAFGSIQIINKVDDTLFDEKDLSFVESMANVITSFFIKRTEERVIGLNTKYDMKNYNLDKAINASSLEEAMEILDKALRENNVSDMKISKVKYRFKSIYRALNNQ